MAINQSPQFIDWVVTSRCNLNCRHCRGMEVGEIASERTSSLIEEITRLKPNWVIVEGGEPLLREDIFELLGALRRKELDIHLITNGMLVTAEVVDILKQLGIHVMISLDGTSAKKYETIRKGANFSHVIGSIKKCVSQNVMEAINFTIMQCNYHEIPQLFNLARSLGVPKINLIGLKPCSEYNEELLSPAEYLETIKLTCESSDLSKVEYFFDEPFFWAATQAMGLVANIPSQNAGIVVPSMTACAFGEYLFIEPNGDVKPCSFTNMVLANVNECSLEDVWLECLASPILKKIKDPQSRKGYCQGCPYLEYCKGCRSRTHALTGDWFKSDPVCPLPLIEDEKDY